MNNLRCNEKRLPKKQCENCKHSNRTFFSHAIVLRCILHKKTVRYGESCSEYEEKHGKAIK